MSALMGSRDGADHEVARRAAHALQLQGAAPVVIPSKPLPSQKRCFQLHNFCCVLSVPCRSQVVMSAAPFFERLGASHLGPQSRIMHLQRRCGGGGHVCQPCIHPGIRQR